MQSLRKMSALPPIAAKLVRRNELTRCANRVLTRCTKKHRYSMTSSTPATSLGGILRPGDCRAHNVIFETGVTVHQWPPSEWVIKLDCIVIEQIPPRTIATSPERFLTTFLSPKGRYRGSGGNEQPNGRSIKRSHGHRLQISGDHGRPA
jgi:hypothetical protein